MRRQPPPVAHHAAAVEKLEQKHAPFSYGRTQPSPEGTILALFDCLADEELAARDGRGFYSSREHILRAFVCGKLYVLHDPGCEWHDARVPLDYAMAFAVYDTADPEGTILWVHQAQRGRGYAECFVEQLDMTHVFVVPEAERFWLHMGFRYKPGAPVTPAGTEMWRVAGKGDESAADDMEDISHD